MKKFFPQDYIDIENDRGQEFERTKNDIMSESVLVSGYYYVDEDAISTKKANHEIFRGHIIECTKVELNEMRKNQLHEDDPPMKEQMNPT